MELKEGMYVRTEDGEILKIKYIEDVYTSDDIYIAKVIYFGDSLHINSDVVTKASYNIIDLIEVGDYVNGELVEYIEVDSYKDYVINSGYWCKQKNIKSIVTKEQFEQIQYKVGD